MIYKIKDNDFKSSICQYQSIVDISILLVSVIVNLNWLLISVDCHLSIPVNWLIIEIEYKKVFVQYNLIAVVSKKYERNKTVQWTHSVKNDFMDCF